MFTSSIRMGKKYNKIIAWLLVPDWWGKALEFSQNGVKKTTNNNKKKTK